MTDDCMIVSEFFYCGKDAVYCKCSWSFDMPSVAYGSGLLVPCWSLLKGWAPPFSQVLEFADFQAPTVVDRGFH